MADLFGENAPAPKEPITDENIFRDRFIAAFEAAAGKQILVTAAEARDYALDMWRAYWEDPSRDDLTPEEWAEADIEEWE